jgi:hypothetical protein
MRYETSKAFPTGFAWLCLCLQHLDLEHVRGVRRRRGLPQRIVSSPSAARPWWRTELSQSCT